MVGMYVREVEMKQHPHQPTHTLRCESQQFSTMAAASGGVCLVVAVFSGPALVFIAVFALGMYEVF